MYAFEDQQTQTQATTTHSIAHLVPSQTVVQTFSNPDGTVSLIQVSKPMVIRLCFLRWISGDLTSGWKMFLSYKLLLNFFIAPQSLSI